ncbi:MAG: hypothetical protein K9H65_05915, partial [Bacteroidales bacterium]|nr:hypothetical protein [Bacteroidales bacterium]
MDTDLSQIIFNRTNTAFVHHKLICDTNGQAVDFEIIKANPAYEKLTGLQNSQIEGERASRLSSGVIEEDIQELLKVYEDTALNE